MSICFRAILKRRKQYEYRLQRIAKSKEDVLRYIQYEMDLLKLIKQKVTVSKYITSILFFILV